MKRFVCAVALFLYSSGDIAAQSCGEAYTLRPGDSLSKIAENALGSIFDYELIYEANQGVMVLDPNNVEVGTTLYIPCKNEVLTPIDWEVLAQPDVVSELLRRGVLQVLDIRSRRDAARGILPGAIWVPYDHWRSAERNPDALPSEAELNLIIGKAGLRLEQPIAILHEKGYSYDAGKAAFVYWQLKSMGAERLALLEGGFAAWTAAGMPVEPGPPPSARQPYVAGYELSDTWRATGQDVAAVIDGDAPGWLLDARPALVYRQVDRLGQIVPTTLPGALNAPVETAFRAVTRAGDLAEARQSLAAQLGEVAVEWGQAPVISFGATGELAALNWFYASELLGQPDVLLYAESTRGWTRLGGKLVAGSQPGG